MVERIDVSSIQLGALGGQWVGVKGRDLVLANVNAAEPVLALAAAD